MIEKVTKYSNVVYYWVEMKKWEAWKLKYFFWMILKIVNGRNDKIKNIKRKNCIH